MAKKRKGKPHGNTGSTVRTFHYSHSWKERTCLFCGELFDSDGPGNRRCKKCADYINEQDIWEQSHGDWFSS